MSSPGVLTRGASLADYVELTKPRITPRGPDGAGGLRDGLAGHARGRSPAVAAPRHGLVAAGASALNMVLERDTDALMQRTRERPLPAGRLRAAEALAFGLAPHRRRASLCLSWLSGPLAAAVAFATWVSYLFVYTPLKRAHLALDPGGRGARRAAPGDRLGGGARRLDRGAFVLFAILFLWQIPHFLAIAWIYREDYARGGLPMLPVVDPEGHLTGRQAVAHSLALLLVSLAPDRGRAWPAASTSRARSCSASPSLATRFALAVAAHHARGALALPRLDPLPPGALRPCSWRPALSAAAPKAPARLVPAASREE